MTERSTATTAPMRTLTPVPTFDDLALACCGRRHVDLVSDPKSFSLCRRAGRLGPVTVSELVVGSDISMDSRGCHDTYQVLVLQNGRVEGLYKGAAVSVGPGATTVLAPQRQHTNRCATRWTAGTKMMCLTIDRHAVDEALSDALGYRATSQIDSSPSLPAHTPPVQGWVTMLGLFTEQILRQDGLLTQPLVGMPFVDSLVRGFLLAAPHPHREAVVCHERSTAPRAIRTAIEYIEQEAHSPLTLSSIASHSHLSVRTLQYGFRRYLETSPMAYLREVRLRRTHQTLLEADPSVVTVAAVASRWGFANLGRFAATYSARYHEKPAETLRRNASRRT